jgi:O-antigen/teichoic acid export membrane protein
VLTAREPMIAQLQTRILSALRSDFGRNALWFTSLSGFERLVAVCQTVVISRALGIKEYGVYGLLFGTIGFVASIVGLQMGLTATVFVSKYRETDKPKAAAVISIVDKFGWLVATLFAVLTLPFSSFLSSKLVGSDGYQLAVSLGILFVGTTILSGVQDGVAQGFEAFGVLAKLKIAVALLALAATYPMARQFGLNGALMAILSGLVLKLVLLQRAVRTCRSDADIPDAGFGVSFRALVSGFALPSMATSLLLGAATWFGLFMLSRQDSGFEAVAVVNTGLQWRGPVLLLAASLGGVAIPRFSRLAARGDEIGGRRLRMMVSLFNFGVASVLALAVVAGSGIILRLYGNGFAEGSLAFSLIVLSTVPNVVANVYLQHLVGAAKMWQQLWLHCPFLVVMSTCFLFLVPRLHALGYSVALLLSSIVLLATVLVASFLEGRSSAKSVVRI